ncbi:SGNH/GDSL hydrolase family protein [Rhodovulum strictum]|uniref:VPLPA-CTERM sorting domain-containing protein n=1 Tax=Rhodovulum strictum TaxID=58314 RepID=A0A844B443_9RHOB|nr:SGNH/GDSL hydrolase family protein [Rhodovulum strictum]MRH21146.1 VPLPA-CTERM sorting domain-containing protein [Rhodovulum strictum]
MKQIAFAAMLALAPIGASAGSLGLYTDFFVFGDSLSDPGNTLSLLSAPILGTIYPQGQFTDGATWASQLGADLGSGANFAFGGAAAVTQGTVSVNLPGGPYNVDLPDFTDQRAAFAPLAPTLGANPLAAVWFGGNDLRDAFRAADPVIATPAAIAAAVTAIATGVQDLIGAGIGTVAVFGLPDLGKIPEALASGAAASAAATAATMAFNATLQSALAGLGGGDVRYVDIFGLFELVRSDAAAYGFTNITTPCLDDLLVGNVADCGDFLFHDTIHPTARAHALIAERFLASVAPVPLPAGGVLLLAGLGGLALVRRRRFD